MIRIKAGWVWWLVWKQESEFGESDQSFGWATASYQKESAFDKSNSTYSYGDYVFNDDMVTRYKQIRIVNNFLLNIERLQCWVRMKKKRLEQKLALSVQCSILGWWRYGGAFANYSSRIHAGNTQALYQARDTEAATYDFIIKECKAIYGSLPKCAPIWCQISDQSWGGIGFVVSCSIVCRYYCQIL